MWYTQRFSLIIYLVLPCIVLWYISLYLTMEWWYPGGLASAVARAHVEYFSVVFALWLLVFFIQGLFDVATLRSAWKLLARLLGALFANLLLASLYFYFQPALLLTPRRFLLVVLGMSGVFILAWFLLVRFLLQRFRKEYIYSLYNMELPEELGMVIKEHGFAGLKFNGYYTVDGSGAVALPPNSYIILPSKLELPPAHMEVFLNLQRQGVQFIFAHVLYERLTRRIFTAGLSEWWFLENVSYRKRRLYDFLKRCVDTLAGFFGLIVLVVFLPIIALAIKFTSPGPVFFSQRRVGVNNKQFTIHKFRTMQVGINNIWTAPGDSRITSVGRILRRLRLDELPQGWNLLVGEMSIVGPRPEQVHIVEELKQVIPFYNERHSIKPGLTGWAQLHIYASTVEESKQKLEYDLYYIKHRSLLFDLEIILKTIYHVLFDSGR